MSDVTELLVDYVSDSLSSEARADVEARLRHDAAFQAAAEPLLAAWRVVPRNDGDTAAAVASLRRAIVVDDVRQRRRPVRVTVVAAAALVACAVLGVYGPGLYRIVAPVVRAHDVVGYATTVGERRTVRLPDGSWATIGPESRVSYRATFFEPVPTVTVRGAATFDAVGPVTVLAGAARVRGTGARFGVVAYPGDADARVTVADGSVQVSAGSRRIAWSVARGVAVHVADTAVVLRPAIDEGEIGWDGDRPTLDRVPLGEAVRAIRHWYGVDVRLGDSRLAAEPVTGTLPPDPRAAVAALGHRVVWNGRVATLH
jgi:transmembrane sensor